jgi:hypothetical protein
MTTVLDDGTVQAMQVLYDDTLEYPWHVIQRDKTITYQCFLLCICTFFLLFVLYI